MTKNNLNCIYHFNSPTINFSTAEGKYYKNLQEILNEEGNAISEVEFKSQIKKEVSKFINNSFDNIFVLAGAGSSIVVGQPYGKTVSQIAKAIYDELNRNEDLFDLQDIAVKCNYDICPLDTNSNDFNQEFNLEDFLSNLLTYGSFYLSKIKDENGTIKEKFTRSKKKILDLIKEHTQYSFNEEFMKHGTLLQVLTKMVSPPSKLAIITTNYDTLFEEASEKFEFTVIDGFTFSENPYFDSDLFDWNFIREIPNVKTREVEYKRKIIDLLKIHGSLTWEHDENNKVRRKNKCEVENPIMIFPSTNKYTQSYEAPYFDLLSKFQECLRKPNTLLLTIGFSFADNHIATMIMQAIKRNKSLNLLVSDFNISQTHSNWKELEKLRDTQFQVAFVKATLNNDLMDYVGE